MAADKPDLGAAAAATHAGGRPGVVSSDARSVARQLLDLPTNIRRGVMYEMEDRERAFVLAEVLRETGSAYGLWADDPVGFVEDVLGESVWSRQAEILSSPMTYKRTIVPAGVGLGKTHVVARCMAHFIVTYPIGTRLSVSIAPRFRQVKFGLWPHLRKLVSRAGLPGECDQVQWKVPDPYGVEFIAAYGFSSADNDESAMQGIHMSNGIMLVVDEAGGISRITGGGTNNLLTNAPDRLIAVGNPPTDDPGSWFETESEDGESPDKPDTVTIRMPVTENPRITGEYSPQCRDCPPSLPAHPVSKHLPNQEWVDNTIRTYGGEDHPYVIAKVFAQFPKDVGRGLIPTSWVEGAVAKPDPEGLKFIRLRDLNLPTENDDFVVERRAWVRLGVDVAAAGGDELVVARAIGDLVHIRHASSGAKNADALDVAERILEEILEAEILANALRSQNPVRVKIDVVGIGWGVYSYLQRWSKLGRHNAQIVKVDVREGLHPDRRRYADDANMRPYMKRDEMWVAGRGLLAPDPGTGEGRLRLKIDTKTVAQLCTPRHAENSSGYTVIESKEAMKKRGIDSPDRAEALLAAVYEPEPIRERRRRGILSGA